MIIQYNTVQRKERFLGLLEPAHDNLVRFARSMTRSDEEARDLVGDTVLQALEKFENLKDEKAFLSWLFTIAVRMHRRREKRRKRFGNYNEEEVGRRPSDVISPEIEYDIILLHQAIRQLKEKEREAILLFEIAGLSLQEIRVIQGGSLSGVKSRLVRGRERLGKLLGVENGIERIPEESEEGRMKSQAKIDGEGVMYSRVSYLKVSE